MKKAITFIVLINLYATIAQKNTGFYGHKAFVQLEGLINRPVFYNILSDQADISGYKRNGANINASNDKINYGFRLNLGYAVKRNLGLLLEFGQDYANVYPRVNQVFYNDGYSSSVVKHEMLDLVSTNLIPKIEFASAKSLLPMGLGHQIGIGVENTMAKAKDYLFSVNNAQANQDSMKFYSTTNSDIDPINFYTLKSVRKIIVLYALSMRTPISKQLMIHYGIRYTVHFGNFNSKTNSNNDQKSNTRYSEDVFWMISKQRNLSLININLGLTYTF